jgi:acetate kinase
MHILVLNSGSSSIKFSVFEVGEKVRFGDPRSLYEGEVSGIGMPGSRLKFRDAAGQDLTGVRAEIKIESAADAIRAVMDLVLRSGMPGMDAVGYRVVHPGARIKGHCRITDKILWELEAAAEFAPLHDPAAVAMIRAAMERIPDAPHFACFDTVFHESMQEAATAYALPQEIRDRGVRRYGFHGLSCESIVRQILNAVECGTMKFPQRLVIAHLGSGCSVTAVEQGRSLDTTMGLTPTGGVVMGTRPGDLDPGLMLYLLRQEGATVESVEHMVNHAAGMVALSGLKNDMKTVREAAAAGDARAVLAIEVFTRSVRKAIGGYVWLMGGVDAIVFAGGIGEHDVATRKQILEGLDEMGIALDESPDKAKGDGVRSISTKESRIAVFVVPSEEDQMIAVHVLEMMAG